MAEAADGPGLSPPVARRERSVEDVLEIEMPVLEAEESGVSEVLSEGCERGDAVPVNRDGRGDGGRAAAVGDVAVGMRVASACTRSRLGQLVRQEGGLWTWAVNNRVRCLTVSLSRGVACPSKENSEGSG